MFENKLNYITAGMVLGLLLLLGRFSYMQVVAYDRYSGQAEQMRTGIALLPPHRGGIKLLDGRSIARTESVWDIYLDLERFADPRTLPQRAHLAPDNYDAQAVKAFADTRLKPVLETPLPNPASRRRFFLVWALRNDPIARQDFELCARRLCLATGLSREEFQQRVDIAWGEVDALANGIGAPATAGERAVSVAWLRAKPALTDNDYWARLVRFPRSIQFEPVLAARVRWLETQQEYLQTLLETADGNPEWLREVCFQAMRVCRARADALQLDAEPGQLGHSQEQDIQFEEHATWLRLADICGQVVRGDGGAVERALEALTGNKGRLASERERLKRLRENVLQKYADDWRERWSGLGLTHSPLLLLRDAPREVVELLKVNADVLPGIVCVRRPSRQYEFARELAHVLGGVGLPDAGLVDELAARESFGSGLDEMIKNWFDGDEDRFRSTFEGILGRQLVGRSGIELTYDERLSGLYGARVMNRDAAGRNRGIAFEQAPVNAEDITLTLDIELQRDILQNVQKWEPILARTAADKLAGRRDNDGRWQKYKWTMRGAAVVLDVKTGAILALCSFPDYDPGALVGRSSSDLAYQQQLKLEELREHQQNFPWWMKSSRHVNRATSGLYASGSTIKAISAIALLESGVISHRSTFDENDRIVRHNGVELGRTGSPKGPGVDVHLALEASSNGFFYRWVQELGPTPQEGWENLRAYLEMFGLGQSLDSDVAHAKRGRLPDPSRVWTKNLAALSIGQGEMLSTPLEVARAYAAIANRGRLVVPHLSTEARTWPEQLSISDSTWDIVHAGLRDVVYGRKGTANKEDVLRRIKCAGKTGTSENGLGVPDHAWFAGYAPYDNPQVAFVILAANSDLYGAEVAPVIGECIERYLQRAKPAVSAG